VIRPRAKGISQSVQDRLKREALKRGRPFAELLDLYAIERFLYRLGRSKHRERFVLKGALLMRHWLGVDARPTRDIDLLGPPDLDNDGVRAFLMDLLHLDVEDDGIEYEPDSLSVHPIREESPVAGLRAKFNGYLGRVLLRYQVDVGLGDAVYPPADEIAPGGLLNLPVATLRAYTPYTAVAEKLEAMVVLGEANSRMKDYYDLAALASALDFDGPPLAESIRRSFRRRSTQIPEGAPEGLSASFVEDPLSTGRWRAFIRKGKLTEASAELSDVVARIRSFALPALEAARDNLAFPKHWPPGGPWRARTRSRR